MSFKMRVLKEANIHSQKPALESFLIKLQSCKAANLLKRDSDTGVFL